MNTPTTSVHDDFRGELRCECGSLVAKLVGDGLELKCRRCKRLALISLQRLGEQPVEIRLR